MINIRHATKNDIDTINKIARQYRDELGYVSKIEMRTAIESKSLHVACVDHCVVGYVLFYRRRDGWQTIYSIAVDKVITGASVGRNLLYSVPCPIRLKVTVDNPANGFYQRAGMQFMKNVAGKKRSLNVYEMKMLYVLCAGNNLRFPEVARQSGMAYGTRNDMKPRDYPFMIDINWKSYDWQDYMQVICEHKPVMAMVPDYEYPSQRRDLYRKIRDLRNSGVLRVMVCPKFAGAVGHIPKWCVIAVSVPSKYAGYISPLHELEKRKMHLLGGSPVAQRDLIPKLNAIGTVISADGNSHTAAARRGGFWRGGKWNFDREAFDYYDLCMISGRNIVDMVNQIEVKQPQLF